MGATEHSQFFFLPQTAWLNGKERELPFLQSLLFRAFLSLTETDLLYLVENLYGSFFSRPMLLAFRERCDRKTDLKFYFAKAGENFGLLGGNTDKESSVTRKEAGRAEEQRSLTGAGRKKRKVRGEEPGAGLGESALCCNKVKAFPC